MGTAFDFARAYPILYVDDEVDNLLVFRATFRDELEVLTASNGAEALEVLQRSPDVAVLLTDQRMPGLTGVDLCERVRDLHPDVQRMLVTAYSDREVAIAAINRGGVGRYIEKPWDAVQLRQILRDAVARAHLERMVRRLRSAILDKERLVGAHAANVRLLQDLAHTNASIQACCAKLEDLAPRLAGEIDAEIWALYHRDVRELRRYVDYMRALERRGGDLGSDSHGRPDRQLHAADGLLDTVVELVRHDLEGNARLSVYCPPAASVWADATDVARILINLVRSAVAALRGARMRGGSIAIEVQPEGGTVRFQITDDGPEIAPAAASELLIGVGDDWRRVGVAVARELALANGGQLDPLPRQPQDQPTRSGWLLTLPAREPRGPEGA